MNDETVPHDLNKQTNRKRLNPSSLWKYVGDHLKYIAVA